MWSESRSMQIWNQIKKKNSRNAAENLIQGCSRTVLLDRL